MNKTKVRFYLWAGLVYFIMGVLNIFTRYPDHFGYVILNNVWAVVYAIVLNYIIYENAAPFVLKKRRYLIQNLLWAVPFLFIFMIAGAYGAYAWRKIGAAFHLYFQLATYDSLDDHLEALMGYSVGSFVLFGLGRHIFKYIKLKQTEQQLRIEKQAAELNYLRAQTNPHFLFNTLNNIYSLARIKSDLAAESILRLSKILRFMLYETGGAYIAVEQELRIMQDYIDLEKLRYDESLRINFNYDVEDMKQALPPLLLIPLVENAFKHGASETRNEPFVDIHLSINKRMLIFVVKNSADVSTEELQVKENIGLSNLRRQLELLYIEHSLTVDPGRSVFTTTLKINLSSHV